MSDNEEKPLGLRDKLMIEVLNAYIMKSETMTSNIYDMGKVSNCDKSVEHIVRQCYKVADIIRKVRLTSFE